MSRPMLLSTNFTLDEFIVSQTATRLGIDNTPTPDAIENLRALCEHVLQPIRDEFGLPIIITSGYRSKELNKAIGGSAKSQHCEGKAADFTVQALNIEDVFRYLTRSNIMHDQLIQEFGSWVHISYNPGHNRKQALYAIKMDGETKYLTAQSVMSGNVKV